MGGPAHEFELQNHMLSGCAWAWEPTTPGIAMPRMAAWSASRKPVGWRGRSESHPGHRQPGPGGLS